MTPRTPASRPRVTSLTPPGAALDEDALARHEPLLLALRARIGRFATSPLARRRTAPPRLATPPTAPRLHWRARPVPFTRSQALGAPPFRAPDPATFRAPRPMSFRTPETAPFPAPDAARSSASRRKQRP
ncbi:hypothetical protein AGRA3207_003432 [Actinomadura graeca]|uniref:Uncharacterized protein n=1 Tax=Actinomadura graeca TaxID=2750812 RepID=A0ABX8QVP2_9ACTN|nr:hypothetical protein [Actinomadura graeca]QXJ22436.1 hypothetical protein AGRA3207_003432 [Actinomadura graeca]